MYGTFFNLEKVRSIFVEEFFIREQNHQSWDKAGSHQAARGKIEENAGGHLHGLSKRQ